MRVLDVSYAFPPVGGAGVQRMLKLVKYLPAHGVQPTVLTVKSPSTPAFDESLLAEVPPGVEVLRARTFEPKYAAKRLAWQAEAEPTQALGARALRGRALRAVSRLGRAVLVPDPQVLWLPGAAASLWSRLRTNPDDVILISGPPFSQFLLAFLAGAGSSVPVVLDYRDEWTGASELYEMSGVSATSELLERAVLRRASVVTTATEEFRKKLLERFSWLSPERTFAIPNGYDSSDFPAELPAPPRERCVLTYTGTVFRLTSAVGFLAGLRRLHEHEPELAKLLDVRFIGRIVETEAAAFEGTEALGVERLGYRPHSEALSALAASHVPLCLLDDLPGADRIYPAKIFEIMKLGRACLALTPEGALARLVRGHRLGEVVHPRDPAAIAEALARILRGFRDGSLFDRPGPIDVERFDRRHLAGEFARALEVARSPRGSASYAAE